MIKTAALCVGINTYPNPQNNLHGCVNDARGLARILTKKYNFEKIVTILDSKARKNKVIKEFKSLANKVDPFGHLLFSVSSHGTTVRDRNGDEPDRKDEAICLYDGFLMDDDFRNILDELPKTMKVTIIADCCHSGTITRLANVYNPDADALDYSRPKFIPYTAAAFNITPGKTSKANKVFKPQDDMNEILLSGCKSDEYSYDANINGTYHGAMTYYLLSILQDYKTGSWNDVYEKLRKQLPCKKYPQTPQLEGSDSHKSGEVF